MPATGRPPQTGAGMLTRDSDGNQPPHSVAEEEDDAGEGDGLNQIECREVTRRSIQGA